MTTVIREGRYVYTDSRVNTLNGVDRVYRDDGPCKLFQHPSRKAVLGLAGTLPVDPLIYNYLLATIDRFLQHKDNLEQVNIDTWLTDLENLAKYYKKNEKRFDSFSCMAFTKHLTYLIVINPNFTVVSNIYPANNHMVIGSGARVYSGIYKMDVPMEEKIKAIYQGDKGSGGILYKFDTHTLED